MTGVGRQRKPGTRRLRRRSWGGAILEFALVLPVLIGMLLGMIEFGRAFMVSNMLTLAAREGARAGAVTSGDNTRVLAAVNGALANQGISTSNLVTTIKVNGTVANASTAATGSAVSVRVELPYNDVSWVGVGHYLGGSKLSAFAVMRRE